ncbi:MAG: hypothetical protein IPK69_11885 [Phycisphaerales bacterium]|nr:MAG: hypothetical protein IPK69_11885 [Phycisphaerales bacterium]
MTAIGSVQVDFIANVGQFARDTRDVTKGVTAMSLKVGQFARKELASAKTWFDKTASAATSFKAVLTGTLAVLGAYRFVSALDNAADVVDKIGKSAKAVGLTVEEMSALRFAAGESGIEFERLATMAGRAAKEVATIVAKGQTTEKIGRLNIRLTDTFGRVRSISELLPSLAKGIESASSHAEKVRLSEKFFGREGGAKFLTFLKESGGYVKGLAEQTERARQLGVLFTDDQVAKLTAYRDSVGRIKEAWLGVKVNLATEVAPFVTDMLNAWSIRIASMPKLIRAAGTALKEFSLGDEDQRKQAADSLTKTRDAMIGVLKTSSIEFGRVAGTALVETVVIGITAAAPAIEDVFRDSIGPILSEIPGVDIELSSKGKLAKLREEYSRFSDVLYRIQKVQDNLDNNPYLEGQDRFNVEKELDSLNAELKRLGDVAAIQKKLAAQERMVALEESNRALVLAKAFAEGFTATGNAADEAKKKIAEATAKFDEARNELVALYDRKDEATESTGRGPSFPDIGGFFDRMVSKAKDTGKQIGANLADGFSYLKERAKTTWKETQEVLKDADQIRFSIYPQEKMEAEIANVRAVRDELVKLGLGAKLTAEDVTRAIEKIRASYAESPEKVRNLANDMRDAIQGFASDASQSWTDWIFDAKGSMKDLLKSWGKTLFAMASQALIFKPLFDVLGAKFGTWLGTTPAGQAPTGAATNADGGPVSGGSWSWVGERGPELVHFGSSGYVYPNGVMPGGNTLVQIFDQRSGGARPEVSENRGPDGRRMIRVLIRDEVRGMMGDGSLDRSLASNYGVGRRGTSR